MILADAASADESTRVVDVPDAERMKFSLTDAQAEELARYAVSIEQHYGRPMDIEWALDGNDGQHLHPAGAAGDREVARRRQCAAPLSVEGTRGAARDGTRDRTEDRPGDGAARQVGGGDGARGRRRCARHRDDRSGLGAGDEARERDRHQSRRTHVSRGDHRARTGHPGGRWLRRRDANADRWLAGHLSAARKATPATFIRDCWKSKWSRSRSTRCRRARRRS